MTATTFASLIGSPPIGARVAQAEDRLAPIDGLGEDGIAALTVARWHRLSGHRNGLLTVFQFAETRDRNERLWEDLAVVGATDAAEITRAMFAEIGMGWREMARGLPAALEASDRLLIASKAHADEVGRARAALPDQLWTFLHEHPSIVETVDSAPPPKKPFLARFFGR